MKKKTDILKKLKLALLIVSACFCCAIMFLNNAFAQQSPTSATTYKNAKDYYEKEAKNVEIDKKVHDILTRLANIDKPWYKDVGDAIKDATKFTINRIGANVGADVSGVVGVDKEAIYYMEQLRNLARGEAVYNDASSVKQNLAQATVLGNYRQYASVVGEDSAAEDIREKLSISLKYALEYNKNLPENQRLTKEEVQLIENEATRLLQIGAEHAKKAAQADGKDINDNITEATADALNPENTVSDEFCASTDFLRAKYQSGCWSCLVVEKLTSAFLTAAKQAYGLSQRAGITLLWIGVVMWLLMWALKNVSSLAQVDPGNILNELIKFMFKVGLAYWFIVGGLPMVRNYFIGPIMGVGASIAQQFWPERFEGEVEDFDWAEWTDEDWKRINEAADKAEAEQDRLLQEEAKSSDEQIIEGAEQISDANAQAVAEAQNKKTGSSTINGKIPDFSLPGTTGTLSSAFGCRPRPKTSCNGKNERCGGCTGSNYHKGVDIGAPDGTPIYAIGSGKITYAKDSTCGHFARITHDGGSGTWVSIYCHMLPKSDNYATTYNRATKQKTGKDIAIDRVSKFQQIGFVGNTGASGGNHLHLGITNNGVHVNPLSLASGEIEVGDPKTCPNCPTEKDRTTTPKGFVRGSTMFGSNGVIIGGDLAAGAGGYSVSGDKNYSPEDSSLIIPIGDIKYSGPTDIMPKSVMNSILGATKAITDITAENMILGDAIMCYSTLERGGAWTLMEGWWTEIHITNAFMWIEGFIIFCFGMLLTLAIVYYLMDMSFKIGFAVIAMPIVVGLWPFNMTKGKFSMCVSIIAKSAATFAFLAMTTTYTVALTESVINWGDTPEAVAAGEGGIAKLYTIMDEAGNIENISKDVNKENMEYAATKLSLFSTTFMLLLFAFLYSFKLVQNTVPDLVDKFFPDKTFGGQDPMHKWATAASKWVKDQAMKPVGYARDIAMNQAGNAIKGLPKNAVGFAKNIAGKGDGDSKTLAGRGMRGAGNVAKGTGKVAQAAGKGVQGIGKGLSAVGKGLQAIPVVGNVIGGAMMAAGKATEVAGKGVEMAGKGVEKAGDVAKKVGDATDKAYNEFGTRNKKDNKDE